MSEQNEIDGANCYAEGDAKIRNWFERQWAAWPERVDEKKTTNISWLYGGVKAYRVEHGRDPTFSEGMAYNVKFLDRHP